MDEKEDAHDACVGCSERRFRLLNSTLGRIGNDHIGSLLLHPVEVQPWMQKNDSVLFMRYYHPNEEDSMQIRVRKKQGVVVSCLVRIAHFSDLAQQALAPGMKHPEEYEWQEYKQTSFKEFLATRDEKLHPRQRKVGKGLPTYFRFTVKDFWGRPVDDVWGINGTQLLDIPFDKIRIEVTDLKNKPWEGDFDERNK